MFGEVIAAHESPVAHGTHKLLLARVRPPVTGELVGAGEPLFTAVPAAAERLLTLREADEERRESVSESNCSHKHWTPIVSEM